MAGGSNVLCDVTPGLRSYRGEEDEEHRRGGNTRRKKEREKNKGEETKASCARVER